MPEKGTDFLSGHYLAFQSSLGLTGPEPPRPHCRNPVQCYPWHRFLLEALKPRGRLLTGPVHQRQDSRPTTLPWRWIPSLRLAAIALLRITKMGGPAACCL